jgi:hypothetical protein
MNRVRTTVGLVALVAILSSFALAAPSMHQGKVTGVGKAELMMLDMKDGETETFVVNEATRITVDLKPAKLVDIQVGFIAEVSADATNDGKLIAKTIAASSKLSPRATINK